MNRIISLMILLVIGFGPMLVGQGVAYSVKGGLALGFQQWDNSLGERNPLFSYHVIGAIEEETEDSQFSLFAQAGYHARGTSLRTYFYDLSGNQFRQRQVIQFNNIGLSLGAKKKLSLISNAKPYYMLGVRGEYTVSTNLAEFDELNSCYNIYPTNQKEFIKNFHYGAIIGGGFEFPFSELVGGILEFSVNPDFSPQYEQPLIDNVINNCGSTPNQAISIPQKRIVNLTLEITVGIRFLNKIEYID